MKKSKLKKIIRNELKRINLVAAEEVTQQNDDLKSASEDPGEQGKANEREKIIRKWKKAKTAEQKNIIEKARTYAAFRCDTEQVNLDGKTPVFKFLPDNIREYMNQDSYQEWTFWNELANLEMHVGEVYVRKITSKAPVLFDPASYENPEFQDYTDRINFLKEQEDVIELLIVFTDDDGRKMIEGQVPWMAITDFDAWKEKYLAFRDPKPEPDQPVEEQAD